MAVWASFGLSRSVFIAGCDIIWEIPFGSESDTALSSRDPVSLTAGDVAAGLSENKKLNVDILIIFYKPLYICNEYSHELYLGSNYNYFGSEIVQTIPKRNEMFQWMYMHDFNISTSFLSQCVILVRRQVMIKV